LIRRGKESFKLCLFIFQMVLFTVNSDDRNNTLNESTTDFTISCERFTGLKDPNRDGAQVTVQSVAFPLTYYNINGNNNVLVYTASAGTANQVITLTNGYYTVTQLAAHIATLVSADMVSDIGAGNSVAVSWSSISMKYTFTPVLTGGGATWTLNPTHASFTAHHPLGFRSFEVSDPPAVATTVALQASFVVTLGYGELYVWCTIPGVTSWSSHRKAWGQLLAVLHPVGSSSPGELIQWKAEWQNGFRIKGLWESVRFSLRDHEDNVVDLNGSDLNITLNITGLKDGLPKAGYFRPSQEMADLFTQRPPWYEKPFLPTIYNNPQRPAGNNGLVLDPGFMAGGQMDRQGALVRKHPHGFSRDAKRNRR